MGFTAKLSLKGNKAEEGTKDTFSAKSDMQTLSEILVATGKMPSSHSTTPLPPQILKNKQISTGAVHKVPRLKRSSAVLLSISSVSTLQTIQSLLCDHSYLEAVSSHSRSKPQCQFSVNNLQGGLLWRQVFLMCFLLVQCCHFFVGSWQELKELLQVCVYVTLPLLVLTDIIQCFLHLHMSMRNKPMMLFSLTTLLEKHLQDRVRCLLSSMVSGGIRSAPFLQRSPTA